MTQRPQEERSIRITQHFEPFNEPGTTVTGIYKGCRMLEFPTDSGVLPQYGIMTREGFVVFNGTYQLNQVLPGLPAGMKVQVVFKGTQRTKKNSFTVKEFEVRVLGDDVDKVLEHFQGFALDQENSNTFLPAPGITVDPVTGEILPLEEEEDSLPF